MSGLVTEEAPERRASRLLGTGLLLAHLLFLIGLFWAGGVHRLGRTAFVALPAQFWATDPPLLSQIGVQALLFLLGLCCAVSAVAAIGEEKPSKPTLLTLFAMVLAVGYFCAIDLHLWNRFSQLLVLLSLAYGLTGRAGAQVAFLAVPLSSPWPALGLLVLPLYLTQHPYRRANWYLAAGALIGQGHLAASLDLMILSVSLLAVLLWEPWEPSSSLGVQAGVVLLSLVAAWFLQTPWGDMEAQFRFHDPQGEHTLQITRVGSVVKVKADGTPLAGPWQVGDKLYANPYCFSVYPEALDSPHFYRAYARELGRRCALHGVQVEIRKLGEMR